MLIVAALCNDGSPSEKRPANMSLQTITDGWLKPYRRYLVPHQKGRALNYIKAGLFAAAMLFAFSLNAVLRGHWPMIQKVKQLGKRRLSSPF